ncbi:DNA polymerase III subunit delta [Hyphococcus luteus]|uniref:DNA-directed DNA polymerase n=1 Tax=Hyphococcus luteus TaxID=2058213 RepID=A0A2S7K6T7_9PROT|nr:DNA polymerase III subunit delta [Marinicaulis flavus]PQA88181.1 DNA polymerase III subunit delta [Marinicaulis flavus]
MVALKGRAIKSFLAARDKDIAAVLIYGPDSGLARERALHLAGRVVEDLKDPFNALELSDADLKDEPGRLADEITALSFAGGERAIRLRTSGEAAVKAVQTLLEGLDSGHLKPNGVVIIEAGELSPRSGLRKAFEKAKRGAALPCYADGPADVRAMAQEAAAGEDLRFDQDALDLLVAILGEDHGLSRAEIDKLILYKGPSALRSGPATISLEDIKASLVDGLGDAMDDTANAAADGAPKRLAAALYKAAAAGASPIGLLRALQRQFARLKTAQDFMDSGESASSAMKKLRPPVFFAEERAFENRLYKWRGAKLEKALRMLIDAELDAKSTGAPQREIVERAALRLAVMGAR